MAKKVKNRGNYPEWQEVCDNFAKKGYKVIPVNYDDIIITDPSDFERLYADDAPTTDQDKILAWAKHSVYWAIQIGPYCNVLVIRFRDLEKHASFIHDFGELPKTVIIESPVHRDYLYKLNPGQENIIDTVQKTEFEILYNDEFIIVPPSEKYVWGKGGYTDMNKIQLFPDLFFIQ